MFRQTTMKIADSIKKCTNAFKRNATNPIKNHDPTSQTLLAQPISLPDRRYRLRQVLKRIFRQSTLEREDSFVIVYPSRSTPEVSPSTALDHTSHINNANYESLHPRNPAHLQERHDFNDSGYAIDAVHHEINSTPNVISNQDTHSPPNSLLRDLPLEYIIFDSPHIESDRSSFTNSTQDIGIILEQIEGMVFHSTRSIAADHPS